MNDSLKVTEYEELEIPGFDNVKMKGTYEFKQYRFNNKWDLFISKVVGVFSNNWKAQYTYSHASIVDEWKVNNLVTSAGKAQLTLLAGDASATPFTYLAVGTSTTAPAVGQTTLVAEITDTGLARAAATVSRVTTTVTNDTLQLVYTWTASGSKTIEEVGVFNAGI